MSFVHKGIYMNKEYIEATKVAREKMTGFYSPSIKTLIDDFPHALCLFPRPNCAYLNDNRMHNMPRTFTSHCRTNLYESA